MLIPKNFRFLSWLPLVCCLVVCGAARGVRADSLSAEIRQAAEKITSVLRDNNQESLAILQFDDKTHGHFGPGIQNELVQAIEAFNAEQRRQNRPAVQVVEQSSVKLTATLQTVDDPNDKGTEATARLLAVEIKFLLRDGDESLFNGSFFVTRVRDIARIEGLNFRVDLEKDVHQTHQELRETISRVDSAGSNSKACFVVDGKRIKATPESQVSVEIAAKSAAPGTSNPAQPRAPSAEHKDFPLVPLGVGEIYEVIVHNDSAEEIAVALTIDGLDQFTFSEDRNQETGRPKFSHWIVAPKSTLPIRGWHKTADPARKDNVLSFLVTKYGEGASQYVPHPDPNKVGVITLAISKSTVPSSGKSRGDAETGFGPPVEVKQTVVQRSVDPPHEFISIRYTHR